MGHMVLCKFSAINLFYFVVFIAVLADCIFNHEMTPDILRPEIFDLTI